MHKLLLALVLFGLTSPAMAAHYCRYTEQYIHNQAGPSYIDVEQVNTEGGRLKFDDSPKTICRFTVDEFGGHIHCPNAAEDDFVFAGKTADDQENSLIIYAGAAWYRDPKCK